MRFPQAETALLDILDRSHPVGHVLVSTTALNPADEMGFGVWELFAQGKCLIGQDVTQPEFDTLGETGGSKEVTLTQAQMPSHSHVETSNNTSTGPLRGWGAPDTSTNTSTPTGYSTEPAGGDQPHNNLPPFVVIRFWKRIA